MLNTKNIWGRPAQTDEQEASQAQKTPLLGKNILNQTASDFFARLNGGALPAPIRITQPLEGQTENPSRKALQKTAKRAMDIVGAGVALLLFSPVFLVLMLLLKLEARDRTLFYGGKRLGRNGQEFKCWKFQTMSPNADHVLETYLKSRPEEKAHWEQYRKLQHDPRVTGRVAQFIRKASLDELPQLWNVLRGDMSLVGPRPILANEVSPYGKNITDYYSVTPGITGYWQVNGRNNVTFARRVLLESWYVKNWSLWLDIVILFKTIPALLNRSGAY